MLTFFILSTRCETNFKKLSLIILTQQKAYPEISGSSSTNTSSRTQKKLVQDDNVVVRGVPADRGVCLIAGFIFFFFLKFVEQKLKQNKHFVCMYQ